MPYYLLSAVALTIHILINVDMFLKKDNIPYIKQYRFFLISIMVFYITDILWGLFDTFKLITPLYVDTFIYFLAVGATIFFWTIFVIRYLSSKKIYIVIMKLISFSFFITEIVLLIINCFNPIFFDIDSNCVYYALPAREIMFYLQVFMYALIALYSIIYILEKRNKDCRRYTTISLFGIIMIICIIFQIKQPLIPYYPIGCIIGVCMLNTYTVSEAKEKLKTEFDDAKEKFKENKEKLNEALSVVHLDPLTGVKSRYAYVEAEENIDKLIAKNEISDFALVVFDINGLKIVNDTLGHEAGDKYIKDSISLIKEFFPTEEIYRFGGDEFVAILTGDIFINRQKLIDDFMMKVDENNKCNLPVVSSGISRYKRNVDNTFRSVFERADKMMYQRKEYLKENNS